MAIDPTILPFFTTYGKPLEKSFAFFLTVVDPCLSTTFGTFAPFSLTVSELGIAS